MPEPEIVKGVATIFDLQNPTAKMSKSADSPQGPVLVLDDPKVIERKIKRAVTDTENEVRFDPDKKPGVANLLQILSVCTGETPSTLADKYTQYGPLKTDTASALIAFLQPVQQRYAELAADPGHVRQVLANGAAKAQSVAAVTLARAKAALGLLPR